MGLTSQPVAKHGVAGAEEEERECERQENDVEQRCISRNEGDLFPHHLIKIPLARQGARINDA